MKNIKRIFCLFLAMLTLSFCFGCNGDGDGDGDEGGGGHNHEYFKGVCACGVIDQTYCTEGLVFTAVDGGYEVSGYYGFDDKVVIPANYEGQPVISIGERVFEGASLVKKLYMSDNVREIKANALTGSGIQYLHIGKGVKTLGQLCFSECGNLSNIVFEATECDAVPSGNMPFYKSGWSTSGVNAGITLTVKSNVTIIPSRMFYYGSSADRPYLTRVIFEDNSQCIEIGERAFFCERNLFEIDFGENSILEKIGEYAFAYCVSLKTLTIPASVTTLGRGMLYKYELLEAVTFEDPNGWEASLLVDGTVTEHKVFTKEEMEDYFNSLKDAYVDYEFTKVS